MLIMNNPRAIIAYAIASESLLALINWMTIIEERDDALYTVAGMDRVECFPVTITYPNSPDATPIQGGLNYHDYGDDPYWAVNT